MGPIRRLVVVASLFALIAGSCSSDASRQVGETTRYRSLDLTTPEAGAAAMIDAWTRDDFFSVVQLFDHTAHVWLWSAMATSDPSDWAMPTPNTRFCQINLRTAERIELYEMAAARCLAVAATENAFRADLSDAAVGAVVADGSHRDRGTSTVSLTLADGRAAEMLLVPSVSGRWRVLQIGVPAVSDPLPDAVPGIWIDACSRDPRLVIAERADCERLDETFWLGRTEAEVQAEIERLPGEEQGSATTGSTTEPTISELIDTQDIIRDLRSEPHITARNLCLIMQGHDVGRVTGELGAFADRAAELVPDVCPGDLLALASYQSEPRSDFPDRSDFTDIRDAYVGTRLETAEDAAAAFHELFEAEEFMGLLVVSSPELINIVATDWLRGIHTGYSASAEPGEPQIFSMSQRDQEHYQMTMGSFDALMQAALEANDFVLDLRGDLAITSSRQLRDGFGESDTAVLVEALVDGAPPKIGFVVVPSGSDEWLVRQVASPPSARDSELGLFAVN